MRMSKKMQRDILEQLAVCILNQGLGDAKLTLEVVQRIAVEDCRPSEQAKAWAAHLPRLLVRDVPVIEAGRYRIVRYQGQRPSGQSDWFFRFYAVEEAQLANQFQYSFRPITLPCLPAPMPAISQELLP